MKIRRIVFFFFLFSTFCIPLAFPLPAGDVQLVTNDQYYKVARDMIKDAKHSIRVMMFEMAYYDRHGSAPTNSLIRELVSARKRGVKVEVILEVREGQDRTTERNRRAGKMLSQGGVEVIYDSPSRTTHAKLMVVDEQIILLGSTNWTYNALSSNNEVAVRIRSKEAAKDVVEYFNKVKGTGSKK